MEREVNLPHQLFDKRFAALPASSSSSSSLSSSLQSVPDCLRHAQAAFKRPRTLGMLTSGIGGARRVLVAQTEPSKSANPDPCVDGCASGNQCQDRRAEMDSHTGCSLLDSEKAGDLVSRHDSVEQISTEKAMFDQRKRLVGAEVTPTDASLAGQNEKIGAFGSKQCSGLVVSDSALNDLISADQHNTFVGSNLDGKRDTGSSYRLPGKASNTVHYQGQPSETISTYGPKKVHFSVVGNASEGSKGDLSNGRVENKQTIGSDPIINYMHGLVRSKDLLTSTSEDGHGSLISASQRADEQMATDTGMESLSSYMNSLALTEGGSSMSNPVGPSTINDQDSKKQGFQHTKIGGVVCSEEMSKLIGTRSVGSGLSATRNTCIQDQCFMGFLGEEAINPTTLSSVAGSMRTSSSFMPPTATSVQCTSAAPRPNSTTYSSCSQMEMGPSEEFNPGNQGIPALPSRPSTSPALGGQPAASIQASSASALVTSSAFQSSFQNESAGLADGRLDHAKALQLHDKSNKGKPCLYHQSGGGDRNVQSRLPQTKGDSLNVNLEPSQSIHPEKVISGGSSVPRRKHYDPDGFFKVNGKLYQKLGRIGRGGSSEVHKVISSDCIIYALKKIKLKGRDYSTAYGFCQEIEYLNKLQGKSNIIQLVDYEVTCKGLLQEVLNGSMTTKDGSIKDDAYIYMVLEYGEIDLAHMLSQKWRDMGSSGWHIDENWLRFYWQQILHAVNTIHEERIVHSDLKPANFLLVKGVLKLIDFGIAKAIMSDTTNIQRDTQVGTLNYMSPEAFMCNDHDANGNTIKCGRPSDIWSLGCILYQMVYGKTPFAEYTSFWPKFKVITDPNHQISYDLVPNPWLLDLMKKCLAWDRNQRWRIPQLLQHPFLVPPVPPCSLPPSPKDHQEHYKLLLQISQEYGDVPEVSSLCSRLQQLLQKINCSKPPSMSHC